MKISKHIHIIRSIEQEMELHFSIYSIIEKCYILDVYLFIYTVHNILALLIVQGYTR